MQHSLHSDLADEDEHVERTGPSQVDRDGAVHDGQAPAPASSSLGDHARHPPIPPYQYSKKQTASKLATSSSSSAAVGGRAARTAVEPTCSHSRHERRGRGDQRHSRGQTRRELSIYLSISLSLSLGKIRAPQPWGKRLHRVGRSCPLLDASGQASGAVERYPTPLIRLSMAHRAHCAHLRQCST